MTSSSAPLSARRSSIVLTDTSQMAEPFVWIGGRRMRMADSFEVRNPYSGEVAGRVGQATGHEVRAALDGAAGRLPLPLGERAAVLDRAARHYDENAESADG